MARPDDPYRILGVDREATPQEIKRAYRALARECHPDVAGGDVKKTERFKQITAAYELLSDPQAKARLDMAGKRRTPGRMAGGFRFWDGPGAEEEPSAPDSGGDLDLEDIFGRAAPPRRGGPSPSTNVARPAPARGRAPEEVDDLGFGASERPRRTQSTTWGGGGRGEATSAGRDIPMAVDVPAEVAARGGTVTVTYKRLRRTDDGRGTVEVDELADVRVPPGVRNGDTLRVEKMGHAGNNGGPYGDLVCDLRVLPPVGPTKVGPTPTAAGSSGEQVLTLPISIQEALLGGRVDVDTPQGKVWLNLPACTSGGSRFRLRGKGRNLDGSPADLVVQLKVVTPPILDDESRALIERFAELNPYNPRE